MALRKWHFRMVGKKGRKAGGVWVGEDLDPFLFNDGYETSFFLVRVSFHIISCLN
jgi:hypothetical protein